MLQTVIRDRATVLAQFIYVSAVTVVVVRITTYVVRLLRRGGGNESRAFDRDSAARYDARA